MKILRFFISCELWIGVLRNKYPKEADLISVDQLIG